MRDCERFLEKYGTKIWWTEANKYLGFGKSFKTKIGFCREAIYHQPYIQICEIKISQSDKTIINFYPEDGFVGEKPRFCVEVFRSLLTQF